jgi:SAM-dependent methyltransferase
MADAARQALASAGSFRFAAVDAQQLPFADGMFDLVVANHMLYHVPDRERAVAEMRRVLRASGRLCAATNALGHLRELDELAGRYVPEVSLAESAERFSLEGGGALLAPHFSDLRALRYDDSLVITEADPVVDYILSSGAAVAADTIEALRQDVAATIAREGAFRVRKETGLFVALA